MHFIANVDYAHILFNSFFLCALVAALQYFDVISACNE